MVPDESDGAKNDIISGVDTQKPSKITLRGGPSLLDEGGGYFILE